MRMLPGALAVAVLCPPALAENWVDIDRAPHVITSIDMDSAVRAGTHVKFWMRQIFDAERRVGVFEGGLMTVGNAQGASHFIEMRSLMDIDCRARTFVSVYLKFYNRDGVLVSRGVGPGKPIAFTPDAVIASGADLLCPKA